MSDLQNQMTVKQESDLSITSMITDRLGQHEVLLAINQLYVFLKKKLTWWNRRQQCAHMMCPVHLLRLDMSTVPLTCLKHCPMTSITIHSPISAQIGLMITNHFPEFCYSFD